MWSWRDFFMRRLYLIMVTVLLAVPVSAGERVFGWVEKAYVPALGVTTKAKMDTGALTSSIYATHVERFLRNGKKWVRFTVALKDADTRSTVTKTLERPFYRRIKLSGAGGVDHRLVVFMDFCIGNQRLHEQVSLSNRANKIYDLLIGRRTMEHLGLLDVRRTFTSEPVTKLACTRAKAP